MLPDGLLFDIPGSNAAPPLKPLPECFEQDQTSLAIDGPLDVLRTAEDLLDPFRQGDQAREIRSRELRALARVLLDHCALRVEHVARAVDDAAHERIGSTLDRGHDSAV